MKRKFSFKKRRTLRQHRIHRILRIQKKRKNLVSARHRVGFRYFTGI